MSNLRIRHHNDILWLISDRPPLNILSIALLDQLTAALRDAMKNPSRLIVLTGAGKRAFCAGVDINDHLDGREVEMLRAVRDNWRNLRGTSYSPYSYRGPGERSCPRRRL